MPQSSVGPTNQILRGEERASSRPASCDKFPKSRVASCSFGAPPRGSSSSQRRTSRGQPPGSGSGSSPVPTPPLPRGTERPLPAPHRTLQLPKPKRGALLSAGIWVVVERLHCLVHELQCRLCSFHGGVGSDGSGSSPRLLR